MPIVIVGIVINFQLIMISSSAKIDRSSALHLIDRSDDRRLFMLNVNIFCSISIRSAVLCSILCLACCAF